MAGETEVFTPPLEVEKKKQIKDTKLANLAYQHYDMKLQKIAHLARGESHYAEQVEIELGKIEAAYKAIETAD